MADTSDNYLAWPLTETAWLRHRGPEPREVELTARRQAVTQREAALLGIGISPRVTFWSLPVALLDGVEPQQGDVIRGEDDEEWIVGDVIELLGHSSRYRVLATRAK